MLTYAKASNITGTKLALLSFGHANSDVYLFLVKNGNLKGFINCFRFLQLGLYVLARSDSISL